MIGVVLNPNAFGVSRDRGLASRLRAVVGADGEVVETRTPEALRAALERFVAAGCTLIGSCGGDGTNLSILSELARHAPAGAELPRLAILRGGTVNTVAENLGITRADGRPDEILARIVARVRRGEPLIEVGQDTVAVNGMVGFLFAAAMGARFLEAYYAGPIDRIGGVAWAGILSARTVASSLVSGRFARRLFEPVPVELTADGERLPIDAVRLLIASVVPSVGIGMKVAWRAGAQPNRFHVVASAISTASMALQYDRVRAGRPLDGAPHVDRLARALEVRFPSPEPFTLDGELFRGDAIHIALGPRVWIVKP